MESRNITLFARPRGSSSWEQIDLTTPSGQRLLSLFRQGDEMTTTATVHPAPHAAGAPPVAKVGWWAKLAGSLTSVPRKVWGWMRRTLHLDSVVTVARNGYGWTRAKAVSFYGTVGPDVLVGVGALAVTTPQGRSLLWRVLSPIRWVIARLGEAWMNTEERLHSDRPGTLPGRFANWLSDAMADAREGVYAAAGAVLSWSMEHPWVVNSMLWAARAFGASLLMRRLSFLLYRLLPGIPVWIITVGIALGTQLTFNDNDELSNPFATTVTIASLPRFATASIGQMGLLTGAIYLAGALLTLGLGAKHITSVRASVKVSKDKDEQAHQVSTSAKVIAGAASGTQQHNRKDRRTKSRATASAPA